MQYGLWLKQCRPDIYKRGKCKNPGYNNPVSKTSLYRVRLNLNKIFTNTVACTHTLFYFSFRSFRKHLRACKGARTSAATRKKNKELFSSSPTTTRFCWWSINLLRFIFYHLRSTDFEEKLIEGLWTSLATNTGKVPEFEFKTMDTVVHRSSPDWNLWIY